MKKKVLEVALLVSLALNIALLVGSISMVASASVAGKVAGQLHLATASDVRQLDFGASDLNSRVYDIESAIGDTQVTEDLVGRLDDLETGAGDEAAMSVDDLATALNSMCDQFSLSEIGALNDVYYQACP